MVSKPSAVEIPSWTYVLLGVYVLPIATGVGIAVLLWRLWGR